MSRLTRIPNAAPAVYERGTDDQSVLPVTITPEEFPLHCPVFYLQTVKGEPGHGLVNASDAKSIYGEESFNLTGDYANHQTVGANVCIEQANAFFVHRVTNGTYANIQLYLDVLATDVPVYQREADGAYSLDANGDRIETGATVPGFLCKWITATNANPLTYSDVVAGMSLTGTMNKQVGTMTDGVNDSTLYPICEVPAHSPGAFGNNSGFRLWVSDDLDTDNISDNSAFLYEIALVEKSENLTSATATSNIFGGTSATISFARDAKDSFDNTPFYLPYMVEDRYENTTNDIYPQLVPAFGDIHMYDDDIAEVLTLLKVAEDTYVKSVEFPAEAWTAAETEASTAARNLFNFVSGTDVDGVPYTTFVIDETTSTNSVRLTANNNIMLTGGLDNLLSTADYEMWVRADMDKYTDPDSEYNDKARFVDSMLWDTGFTEDTKDDLAKVIAYRYDTNVSLATFVDNPTDPRAALTRDEELALGIRLRAMIRSYPESDYFGTSAFRGMVIGGSGFINNSTWRRRATLNFDLIEKYAKYMGASNGKMNSRFAFSRAPGNLITSMSKIAIPWNSTSQRIAQWEAGLNMPLHYDTRNMFWPGLQTVADDDTVLNNPIAAIAVAYLNKAAHKAWREFTNVDDLSDGELETALNDFISEDVFGRFDNRFIITPQALHTNADDARGTSWTLPIEIYAYDTKTVQTTYVRVYRRDALGTV